MQGVRDSAVSLRAQRGTEVSLVPLLGTFIRKGWWGMCIFSVGRCLWASRGEVAPGSVSTRNFVSG